MNGLSLQIDSKWAVLSQGDSVNIQNNSPVWDQGNSFSLPFELDIEANRHILGNTDQITGQSVYEVLDGKRAVLYTLGIPVYYGKIKMEDEVELSEGKVDVTLVSGNLTFDEMIDGMNCQDVEQIEEVVIGEYYNQWCVDADMYGSSGSVSDPNNRVYFEYRIGLPKGLMLMEADGVSTVNVSQSYPAKKYCNMRLCVQSPTLDEDETAETDQEAVEKNTVGKYYVYEADRRLSGVCFYVLYFIDCLQKKLNIPIVSNTLSTMEDMNRLAFVNTRCLFEGKEVEGKFDVSNLTSKVKGFDYWISYGHRLTDYTGEVDSYYHKLETYLTKQLAVATSENFPDVEVTSVIDSLKNAFGVRFVYDSRFNSLQIIYVKDILRDAKVLNINAEIHEASKAENKVNGFCLKYNGSDDDTAYNYDDYSKVVESVEYGEIVLSVAPYNSNCYLDEKTGNAYRIKVDEEAKTAKELNPALFEVGGFGPAEYGDCSNEDTTEIVEIGFSPIIPNDVNYKEAYPILKDKKGKDEPLFAEQTFALYLDSEIKYPRMMPTISWYLSGPKVSGQPHFAYSYQLNYTYFNDQYEEDSVDEVGTYKDIDMSYSNNPLQKYDAGFMLGIMRGPGRDAGVEDYDQNYDGEDNYKYVTVEQDYAFHSDTLDNYGRVFDYNGNLTGGVSPEGRFSLKPRAEKPNPEGGFYPITETYAQRRGLFDKFYSEYAYFVVNRKIVRMKCRMEMADLLNIDWTKRYKIGEYVGFINKYSYSVNSTGISDVELEMYYI